MIGPLLFVSDLFWYIYVVWPIAEVAAAWTGIVCVRIARHLSALSVNTLIPSLSPPFIALLAVVLQDLLRGPSTRLTTRQSHAPSRFAHSLSVRRSPTCTMLDMSPVLIALPRAYHRLLDRYSLATQSMTTGFIWGLGDLLAQQVCV